MSHGAASRPAQLPLGKSRISGTWTVDSTPVASVTRICAPSTSSAVLSQASFVVGRFRNGSAPRSIRTLCYIARFPLGGGTSLLSYDSNHVLPILRSNERCSSNQLPKTLPLPPPSSVPAHRSPFCDDPPFLTSVLLLLSLNPVNVAALHPFQCYPAVEHLTFVSLCAYACQSSTPRLWTIRSPVILSLFCRQSSRHAGLPEADPDYIAKVLSSTEAFFPPAVHHGDGSAVPCRTVHMRATRNWAEAATGLASSRIQTHRSCISERELLFSSDDC